MSDIARRIITIFEARAGNVAAVLGGQRTAYAQAGQSARQYGRDIGYLNSQWKAFGTTFRYAIAGVTTYGLAGTIGQLSQIERQLGQIAGISGLAGVQNASGSGQIRLVGQNLRDLESQAREASINVVQPIDQINDAILGLLSTSQGLKQNEIVPIIEAMGKGATLAQTPIENLTQAAAAMNTAFRQPPSLRNFQDFSRQWFTLIGLAPGLRAAGPQILTQFGPLASGFAQGRGTSTQMMSLVLGSLRFGGSPSTALRGLQYLVNSIVTPPSKQAREAQMAIGITPDFVQKHGVYQAILKLLRAVQGAGGVRGNMKALAGLTDEQLDDPSFQLGPQLMTGKGAELLRRTLGRIHAVRVGTILASQLQRHGDVASLQEDLALLADENGQQMRAFNQGWQDFLDNAQLPQAAQSLRTLGQNIASQLQPFIDLANKGITPLARFSGTQQGHTATWGVLAALAGFGIFRFGRGALGMGVRGLPAVKAATDIGGASGQWAGMPGESALHPIYAIVVGQIVPPRVPGVPIPGGGAGGAAGEAEQAATRGRRLGGLARRFGKIAGPAGLVLMAEDLIPSPAGHHRTLLDEAWKYSMLGTGYDAIFGGRGGIRGNDRFAQLARFSKLSPDDQRRVMAGGLPQTAQTAFDNMMKSLAGLGGTRGENRVVGTAHVTVDVNSTGADGVKTTVRKGVDINLFPDVFKQAVAKAPQTRGKPVTPRAGQ